MRLRHSDGQTVHLAYGTNVHPAEDLDGIVAQFDAYSVPVRESLGADTLGLGLWLSAPVVAALAEQSTLRRRLRAELDARGLEVVSLNGFPYSGFHAPVVKHAVYLPDWTTRQRLAYTIGLCQVLADLLPDDAVRGSVSTLPVSWRLPWGPAQDAAAQANITALGSSLRRIGEETGRPIRVAFEPEPGCLVETTAQAVEVLADVDRQYLGVCLDLAHLACAWEDPSEAVRALRAAGLPIVKVQISAALAAEDPTAAGSALRRYDEPRFLHQTRSACGGATDDLGEALDSLTHSGRDADMAGPWRVHYHVPIHAAPAPPLSSTVSVLRDALRELFAGPTAACDHVEVETYTWSVLPDAAAAAAPEGLAAGLTAELAFARTELAALGLAPARLPILEAR
jgi:sugar phosphate isomerase/epimerase